MQGLGLTIGFPHHVSQGALQAHSEHSRKLFQYRTPPGQRMVDESCALRMVPLCKKSMVGMLAMLMLNGWMALLGCPAGT